ncbi:unnamed protein product [Ambrosiozyma monospora]|uniref:Unnamed protein product n=1 Tax=Ambrosiozyma monospora TaxID=43982 RepID=A0A9W6Z470_AMBMO|nr:unnamed protein product [Ambrosiozyma monospora]
MATFTASHVQAGDVDESDDPSSNTKFSKDSEFSIQEHISLHFITGEVVPDLAISQEKFLSSLSFKSP